ncbi:lipid phosphate phosphatase delta [Physcomitrium patens]|nr:lipid phosphate phosphatase delta-like [Physcomitrium patens]|eukprot:XP_024403484.1 lipid phosphate phosphatase delta-like [Physcomitrella patens]
MAGLAHGALQSNGPSVSVVTLKILPTPWQFAVVGAIFILVIIARLSSCTEYLRGLVQPFVLRRVESGVPVILAIQEYRHWLLDNILGTIATVVSAPFYTVLLPMLFWHGQPKLGRQLTLLLATCIYVGNSFKDTVCAPRPPAPVCRIASIGSEKKGSEEYGLPSSHSINITCFSGYILYYLWGQKVEPDTIFMASIMFTTLVTLVIFGRLYLGMHSPIDIFVGCAIGASLLLVWFNVDCYLDTFIIGGEYVIPFWAAISILGLYAYPIPQSHTPSFEDHTAFSGVAFGIVAGVHRVFPHYHSALAASAVSLTVAHVFTRTALGIVTSIAVKEGSKLLATLVFPSICSALKLLLGFRFHSSYYMKSKRTVLDDVEASKDSTELQALNSNEILNDIESKGRCDEPQVPDRKEAVAGLGASMTWRALKFNPEYESMDVDTGIRFVQYAALAWSVADLVPHIFSLLNL